MVMRGVMALVVQIWMYDTLVFCIYEQTNEQKSEGDEAEDKKENEYKHEVVVYTGLGTIWMNG